MTLPVEAIEFWHWWVLGVALIIVESLAPGFFFLWMGVAAGATGVLLLVAPSLRRGSTRRCSSRRSR